MGCGTGARTNTRDRLEFSGRYCFIRTAASASFRQALAISIRTER